MSDEFLTYKTASLVYQQAVKAIPGVKLSCVTVSGGCFQTQPNSES